jgi:predicted ATPase/signal transduction histidine kinase
MANGGQCTTPREHRMNRSFASFASATYTSTEIIHEGAASIVYRGNRISDNVAVIIKTHRGDVPNPRIVAQLRHEHAVLADMQGPGVTPVYPLETSGSRVALVMADIGLASLDRHVGAGLGVDVVLQIITRMADVLHRARQRRIVHKDIKPHNTLVGFDPLDVYLIDWGIASRLRERHTAAESAPEGGEGTLAYIAPEQTGLLDRPIDARTDLYSLGVTFYELLTGVTPFDDKDAAALVKSHLTRTPAPPHLVDPRVPTQVSAIVMKLLQKSAEDRYSSARGLQADLATCLKQWERGEEIAITPLGSADKSSDFRIPQRLYGREPAVAAVMDAYARVRGGSSELLLITGPGGIGKSAVVGEARGPMMLDGAHFVSGKFQQFHGMVPYASLSEALRDLIRQVMSSRPAEIAVWAAELKRALGQNAGLLTQIVPQIERLIGPQPPVAEIGPAEAENRFHLVVQQFVSVFAREGCPLVLFMDDLQWAEPASLKLVERLLTSAERRHLLIIGAYRDQDSAALELLRKMLEDVSARGGAISRVELGPLQPDDVSRLVADTLAMPLPEVELLAAEIHGKTHGSPFFVCQLFTSLAQDGVIRFDLERGDWTWDILALRERAVTDNVAEFMSERLRRLSPATLELLKVASCLGSRFEHDLLAHVVGKSTSACAHGLWEALEEGLVVPLHDDYRLLRDTADTLAGGASDPTGEAVLSSHVCYGFLHDRVQEAAYTLLGTAERAEIHLAAARALIARALGAIPDESVFTVVNHLVAARSVVVEPAERVAAARLSARAGRRAKASVAYGAARDYLAGGIAYLPENGWAAEYDLAFALHGEHAEVMFLAGDVAPAEAVFDELLGRARTPSLKVGLHVTRIKLYNATYRHRDIVRLGRAALDLIEEPLPDTDDECQVRFDAEIALVMEKLGERPISELVDAPTMTDPRRKSAVQILLLLDSPSFVVSPRLSALVSLRQVLFSLRHGHSELSACVYAAFGMMMFRLFGKSRAADAKEVIKLALALDERFPNAEYAAKIAYMRANAAIITQPLREAIAYLDQAAQVSLAHVDVTHLGWSHTLLNVVLFAADEELDAISARLDATSKVARMVGLDAVLKTMTIDRQVIANLKGDTLSPRSLSNENFDEEGFLAASADREHLLAYYWYAKINLLCLNGEHVAAAPLLAEAEARLRWMWPFMQAQASFAMCLLLCRLLDGAAPADAEHYQATLEARHGMIAQRRALCEETWRCPDLLVAAERARLVGRDGDARQLYEEAISLANADGRLRMFALSHELCGKFELVRGRGAAARAHLSSAREGWLRWGATAKAEALSDWSQQSALPESAQASNPDPLTDTSKIRSTVLLQGVLLDLSEAMRAGHAISSEIIAENVIRQFLLASFSTAAVQRSFVVVIRDDEALVAGEMAEDSPDAKTYPGVPLESTTCISHAVVRYVAYSQEPLILNNGDTRSPFFDDPYLRAEQPKAVLCLPLVHHGLTVAVWYAESPIASGFRRGRIELLQMLASQAASALANARLYDELEQKTREISRANERLESEVAERTSELRRETMLLKQAQAQLVKLEKQATEVQMAGGFAHEMRNALAGASIYLKAAYNEENGEPKGLCRNSVEKLGQLLGIVRASIPAESLGRAENLIRGVDANERRMEDVLRRLRQAIGRSLEVTSRILDYSRKGFEQPGQILVDLGEVIQSVMLENEIALSKNDITIDIEAQPSCELIGSEGHFFSILSNLVANARDALLDVHDRPRKIGLKLQKIDGDILEIRVKDNGIGIALEHRAAIFDTFFSTKPSSGTGLGLGIVQKLVTLYEGTIDIESEVGLGTTMTVRFPFQRTSLATTA